MVLCIKFKLFLLCSALVYKIPYIIDIGIVIVFAMASLNEIKTKAL
jgi:hypothetical protein